MKTLILLPLVALLFASCGTKAPVVPTPKTIPSVRVPTPPTPPDISRLEETSKKLSREVRAVESRLAETRNASEAFQSMLDAAQEELAEHKERFDGLQTAYARVVDFLRQAQEESTLAQESIILLQEESSDLKSLIAVQNREIAEFENAANSAELGRIAALQDRDLAYQTIPKLEAQIEIVQGRLDKAKKRFWWSVGIGLGLIGATVGLAKFRII